MTGDSNRQGAGPVGATVSFVVAAVVVLLAGLGIVFLLSGGSGSESPQAARPDSSMDGQTGQDAGQTPGAMPEYVLTASEDTKMAYQFALDRPDVLMWMPCYCGCGEHSGHKSSKNCFLKESSTAGNPQFDEHGASCAMCVGIALDAKRMTEEGRSLSEIRTFIDEEYGSIGPGTDTPLPPA